MRSTSLLLVLALALPLFARDFDVRPAPAWVERVDAETSINVAKDHVRWGIFDILGDHQVRVTDSHQSHYFRTVRRVLSPSGVQNASELELDFDPTFERLVIHDVAIVRGAERINALDADDVRVIDKEDDADERLYGGDRSALIFIRDVRPGDVIDYSWSIEGANPILGGKYVDDYDLSSSVPARYLRHRLVWPAGRPLHWRGFDPSISMMGNEQVLVWERRDVAAIAVEDSLPSWYEPWESVQLTEFASWNEVATWADDLFRIDAHSTAAVKELAAKITREHATRDARITAVIRFVQDDIRYLGIELGRNSHQPHQPSETLDSRWGDCKDKSLLLVALLRELGVTAYPALVNTRLQHRLEEKLPSAFLFDHVIAQVVDGGRVYWVDGTIADQGGSLATLVTPTSGRALVIRPETHSLTRIIANARSSIVVEQVYTTTDYSKPTRLQVKTTYSGSNADAMRAALASMSREDFAGDRINRLATDQPKIEADGLPNIADDRLRNVIVVAEKYVLPDLWQYGDWSWYPRTLDAHFRRPETMIRSMPLEFDYPLDVRQSVRFDFPEEVAVEKSTSVTETPTFRYEYVVDHNGKSVWIRQSLQARRDFVDVKDVPDHLTKLNAIWSGIGYRLEPPGAREPAAKSASALPRWGLGAIFAAAFVAICWMLATRRARPLVPVPAFRPGEAPASALEVRGADEIHRHLAGLPCPCGAHLDTAPDVQRALYAEREMTIVTRNCGACGREQSIYFTAA